jgi:hypothetical protein
MFDIIIVDVATMFIYRHINLWCVCMSPPRTFICTHGSLAGGEEEAKEEGGAIRPMTGHE